MDHENRVLATLIAVMFDFICPAEPRRQTQHPTFDPKAVEFTDHVAFSQRCFKRSS